MYFAKIRAKLQIKVDFSFSFLKKGGRGVVPFKKKCYLRIINKYNLTFKYKIRNKEYNLWKLFSVISSA
jgi:hypothetical protein